jgi:exodeoxyribonuclease V alpha subunit
MLRGWSVEKPQPKPDNLAGLVERVTFHNQHSGFCVLRVKVRGHRGLITVVGHAAIIGVRRRSVP